MNTAHRNSQFKRGQGCYTCASCGRNTRDTGVQSIGSELCAEDYELAGIYNVYQDDGKEGLQPYVAEIRRLTSAIVAKGGKLDDDARELLAQVAL